MLSYNIIDKHDKKLFELLEYCCSCTNTERCAFDIMTSALYLIEPLTCWINTRISTEVWTCWSSRFTFQWISQPPAKIEPYFYFIYALPAINESLCRVRFYLYWKKMFYKYWSYIDSRMPKVDSCWSGVKPPHRYWTLPQLYPWSIHSSCFVICTCHPHHVSPLPCKAFKSQ